MKKKLKYLVIFIFIFILNSLNMKICFGEESHPKILVIGSYSIDNEWEDDVIKGFKKIIRDDVVTKIEFIDSKYYYGDINYELLVNFLNSKYANGV